MNQRSYFRSVTVKGVNLSLHATVSGQGRSINIDRVSRQHCAETALRLLNHGWTISESGSEKDQIGAVLSEEGPFYVLAYRW